MDKPWFIFLTIPIGVYIEIGVAALQTDPISTRINSRISTVAEPASRQTGRAEATKN
jgi:hypothetical protein